SFSRGEQNDESDVDVLITLKAPSLFLYAEIQSALESVLKRSVDLVSSKARKREGFDREISKDLIYV
ncbi:MAG: nucleotidyltransferase domain-containing protein, partial [Bacteroidales bacterium]|nr:nucleotidyltransferase domain-containing protein [Candidatus Cacconaster equi]